MASLASFQPQGGTVFLIQETSCRLWRGITKTFDKTIVSSLYTFDFTDLLLCEYITARIYCSHNQYGALLMKNKQFSQRLRGYGADSF